MHWGCLLLVPSLHKLQPKLCLCLIKQYAVTNYGEVKVELLVFSTSDGGQLHALNTLSVGRTPALTEKKKSCKAPETEIENLVVQHVV